MGSGIKFTYEDKQSLASHILPALPNFSEPGLKADPFEPSYMSMRYSEGARVGPPASAEEIEKRRSALSQILQYEADFWKRMTEIKATYGKEALNKIVTNIYREQAERTIQFLLSQGIWLNIRNNFDNILSAEIRRDGDHPLNQKAAELYRDYGGLTLHFVIAKDERGAYEGRSNKIFLSADSLSHGLVDGAVLSHELGHARNELHGTRDMGSAVAKGKGGLPGNPIAYGTFQSYEEAELQSQTIHDDAQDLLKRYIKGQLADIAESEVELLRLAFQSTIVAERNSIVTHLLDKALSAGLVPAFWYGPVREQEPDIYTATIPLTYENRPFEYKMTIHNRSLSREGELIAYIKQRVSHMSKLNPNYTAQFNVAMQAIESLLSARSSSEKIAVLEGIIAITGTHFWEEKSPSAVTEQMLIDQFHHVVADRLGRSAK